MPPDVPSRAADGIREAGSARVRWIVLVLAIVAFVPLGDRPLHEPDEGRYGLIGQTMLLTGNWLEPEYMGQIHKSKPPFAYWATGASQALFGHGTFGVRFPAALAFFLTGLVSMALARRLIGPLAAAPAGLVWATMPLTFGLGQFMSTDMLVAFWQALGVLGAVAAWQAAGRPRSWRLLFWFAFGMAFFTKGPPGLLGMLPVAWGSWQRRRQREPGVLWSRAGCAVFLVTATWWYAVLELRHPGIMRYWIENEVVARVATTQHGRNSTPLIYLGDLTLGALPWVFLYLPLARRLAAWWRDGHRIQSGAGALLAIWILLPLAIFVLVRSRMPGYLAPLCVPLALVFASLLLPRLQSFWRRRNLIWLGGWIVLLLTLNHLEPEFVRPGYDAELLAARILAEGAPAGTRILNATGMHLSTLDTYLGTGESNVELDRGALQLAADRHMAESLGLAPDPEGRPTLLLVRLTGVRGLEAVLNGLERTWSGSWIAAYRLRDIAGHR